MVLGGIKLALVNAKNTFTMPAMKIAMIGVALIPVIFAGAYLSAFLNPYANIDTINVAVVNEDEGALIGDEFKNVGEQVCDKLNDADQALGWHFVSAEEAESGLEDGSYYMSCTIPSYFSSCIASAESDSPERAILTIKYNESKNMLASQIGSTAWEKVQSSVNQSIIEEYWLSVLGQTAEGAEDLNTAADGAGELASGLQDALEGNAAISDNLETLADGAQALEDGLGSLQSGASKVQDATQSLSDGLSTLSNGSSELKDGANSLNESTSALQSLPSSTAALAEGASQVSSGASALSAGTNMLSAQLGTNGTLITSLSNIGTALQQAQAALDAGQSATAQNIINQVVSQLPSSESLVSLGKNIDGLNTAASQLASGSSQVSAGATQLSSSLSESSINKLTSGISALASGANSLDAGLNQASSGASELAANTPALSQGASNAQSGAVSITSGATQLAEGSNELGEGLTSAQLGSDELQSALSEAADSMAMSNETIQSRSEIMSEPVQLNEEYITSVKNYGTGFAPFFLGLAMWVGAIFACFVFNPLNTRLCLSRANPFMTAFSGYLPMGIFAILQAIIAMAFVQFFLQVQINNVFAYYAIGILTSLVFMAIIQFLVSAFGFPGRFIAVVLLTLQLTSASGTFPVSTAPEFFQTIAPFMPLTYVVEAMREVMTGTNISLALGDCGIIALFGIAFFLLTVIVALKKRVVNIQTLHPLLEI